MSKKYDVKYFDGSTYAVGEEYEKDLDQLISHTIAETLKEAIELSDLIERQEPDGGTKQWMAFKRFRNTLRDRLAATTAVEGVGKK